ncbi:MAG: hypothetical protein LBG15_15855 [Dysgonamonadaceae bacterium]|jgi:hypothetical protein|nr:hypothetical protein [Dysgonamonadaceae bacterium]
MKYKNILVIFTLLSISVCSLAVERTDRNAYPESKFVDRFSSSSLRDDDGTGNTEGETGNINLDDPDENYVLGGPVGDALPLLITFGLTYGIYVFIEKRKRTEIK